MLVFQFMIVYRNIYLHENHCSFVILYVYFDFALVVVSFSSCKKSREVGKTSKKRRLLADIKNEEGKNA